MTDAAQLPPPGSTAVLVLASGRTIWGRGLGSTGSTVGEVCFNTSMTGYQEILTDPSYAGQIITFTFPHIGNVGTNDEDIETVNMAATPGARGVILRSAITDPSNYRSSRHLDTWLKTRGIIGLSGIDTRALTALIRSKGMPNAVIAYSPSGTFDLPALKPFFSGPDGKFPKDSDLQEYNGLLDAKIRHQRVKALLDSVEGFTVEQVADAARKLGWHPFHPPAAINSTQYRGRPTCAYHGYCATGGCHVSAKGSTAVTTIPKALATMAASVSVSSTAGVEKAKAAIAYKP